MRKLFTMMFCLFAAIASADEIKMALLQPRVAEGSDACRPIELNMVRGELRKAFGWQSNLQVLTRTDVDQMLKELGFQQSGMVDDDQRMKVGEMTGAQYICVSTITKEGTQLYIESYLVNVETGQMTNPATQFASVQNNDYSTLQEPCNKLAKEMLGELDGTPSKFISSVSNKAKQIPEGYVDLGLPSGTLWKNSNEKGYFTYDEAEKKFGRKLPTNEQMQELVDFCEWEYVGDGYRFTGPNGKSITLVCTGTRECDGSVGTWALDGAVYKGSYYWSYGGKTLGLNECSSGKKGHVYANNGRVKCEGHLVRLCFSPYNP